ncbi:MAG: hypothetical protein GX549_03105, partial [Clostridiales bacterium]|nr:hypothetical protein [Clostridiales bacterium]
VSSTGAPPGCTTRSGAVVGAAVGLGVGAAVGLGVGAAVGLGVVLAVTAEVGLGVVFPGVSPDGSCLSVGAAVFMGVTPAVAEAVVSPVCPGSAVVVVGAADDLGVASALSDGCGMRVAVDSGSDETGASVTIRHVKRTPQEALHSITAVMSAIKSMVVRALRVIECPFVSC